jgi:hypothetical protein
MGFHADPQSSGEPIISIAGRSTIKTSPPVIFYHDENNFGRHDQQAVRLSVGGSGAVFVSSGGAYMMAGEHLMLL